MGFAANNIPLMRNCTHSLVRKAADVFPELSESELNMKTDLVIEMINKLLNSFITNYYSNFIHCTNSDFLIG